MRDDVTTRTIIIDHHRVDPLSLHQPHLLSRLDHQLLDPLRYWINLAFWIQLLLVTFFTKGSLGKLWSISVAITKEIFCPKKFSNEI